MILLFIVSNVIASNIKEPLDDPIFYDQDHVTLLTLTVLLELGIIEPDSGSIAKTSGSRSTS